MATIYSSSKKDFAHPDLADFKAWMATMPRKGPYNSGNVYKCPVAAYWKDKNPSLKASGSLGELAQYIFAPTGQETYEALYERLFKTAYEKPSTLWQRIKSFVNNL